MGMDPRTAFIVNIHGDPEVVRESIADTGGDFNFNNEWYRICEEESKDVSAMPGCVGIPVMLLSSWGDRASLDNITKVYTEALAISEHIEKTFGYKTEIDITSGYW